MEKNSETKPKDENTFVNSLFLVAKQLERISKARDSRKEFDNEVPNFPSIKDVNMEQSEDNCNQEITNQECLKMEVFDDKDYDIEEVKFWNFISKNKGVKPTTVRTIVYKVPEATYVIKKCPVIIKEPEEPAPETSTASTQTHIDDFETQSSKIEAPKSENEKIAESCKSSPVKKPDIPRQKQVNGRLSTGSYSTRSSSAHSNNNLIKIDKIHVKSANLNTTNTYKMHNLRSQSYKEEFLRIKPVMAPNINNSTQRFVPTKFNMEDLIIIDQEDDVIEFNENDSLDESSDENRLELDEIL